MSDVPSISTEAQLKALFILSLESLSDVWSEMCLRVQSRVGRRVREGAHHQLANALSDVEHISDLLDDSMVAQAFSSFSEEVRDASPDAHHALLRWVALFIHDETQATIDWNMRMLLLDAATKPQLLSTLAAFASSPVSFESLVLAHRNQVRMRADRFSSFEARLPPADLALLSKERLPLGGSFLYPTLELAFEVAARCSFLHAWREIDALLSEAGSTHLQRLMRARMPKAPASMVLLPNHLALSPGFRS